MKCTWSLFWSSAKLEASGEVGLLDILDAVLGSLGVLDGILQGDVEIVCCVGVWDVVAVLGDLWAIDFPELSRFLVLHSPSFTNPTRECKG